MEVAELVNELQTRTLLSALKPQQLAQLAAHARQRPLAAGEVLFRQGDPAEHFYVVRDGSVLVGVPAINGPALEVQQLGADEVLGWSWLIPPYRWSFEARAVVDSTLVEFDGKALLQACERDPALGYAVMKVFASLMSTRLHAARMRMMESWAPSGWA